MRKTLFTLFLIIIAALSSLSYAQEFKFRKPLCIMDVTFGYSAPSFDFSGSSIADFYNFKSYGVTSGYSAKFTTKFAVANADEWQFRPYFSISYSRFTGSDNFAYGVDRAASNGYIPNWPSPGFSPIATPGTSSVDIHSPYLAFGFETAVFTDRHNKSEINFGTDLSVTVMWGKILDQRTSGVEYHNSLVRNTRIGWGLNAGYTYRVSPAIGLTAGTRLQISNLFGKSTDKSITPGDLFLNDAADAINPLLKNRTIGFYAIHGGVSFYIGELR